MIGMFFWGWLLATPHAALIAEPVPPSSAGNLLLDNDHDGQLDAIQMELVSSVSQPYLDSILDSVVVQWVDTLGAPFRLSISGHAFALDTTRPKRLTFRLPDSSPVAKNLTSIDNGKYPWLGSTAYYYTAGNKTPMPVRLRESMAPVLVESRLSLSRHTDSFDTLEVLLSETVQQAAGVANPFAFRSPDKPDLHILRVARYEWINGNQFRLFLPADQEPRLAKGDSLRIQAGALTDMSGNRVGETTLWRLVEGQFPFAITSRGKATVDTKSTEFQQRPLFQVVIDSTTVTTSDSSWLGAGMLFGSPELAYSIQTSFTDNERYTAPDPSKTWWQLELWIYSLDGQLVNRSRMQVACNDVRFVGNCFANPQNAYLRWNLRSSEGRAVGTGAYLARIASRLLYDGHTIHYTTPMSPGGTQTWGVMRHSNGKSGS